MSTGTTTRTTTTTTTTTHYWERRRALPLWPFAMGAAGLVGLGLLHGIPVRHSIEEDLESRADDVLAAAGASGLTVDFTGQDGVVSGSLPPGVDREQLLAQLMGTMRAPVAKFVQTLNEVPGKFVRTLAAVHDPLCPPSQVCD